MRRRIGISAIAIGIFMTALAIFSAMAGTPGPSGDSAAVVASLESDGPNESETTTTTTTAPAPEQADPQPVPLWQGEIAPRLSSTTAAAKPASLRIDSIDVSAPIAPYGVNTATGQMDVPRNVEEVAWYEHGPTPGAAGSAVLAAHVDLHDQGPGVFFRLTRLNPGDVIFVSFDDGTEQRFVVEARTTYEKEDLPVEAIFSRTGPTVLTLITCGGGFSSTDRRYDSNVVVYAVPDPPLSPTVTSTPIG